MSSPALDEKPRFHVVDITAPTNINFSEDHASTFAIDMSLIHNVFIRCLNSIYHNAPLVKKGDQVAFAGYCLAFTEIVHGHHHAEEEIIFPFLQSRIDMNHNLEQHAEFVTHVNGFEEYIKGVKRKREIYDGERVRKFLDDFGDILVQHLHDEIPTISPDQLKQFDETDLHAMFKRLNKHIKKLPLTTSVVLALTHHNSKQIPTWPPLPKPIKWIVKNVAYWRHKSYWKFSPFTRNGNPRTYP